MFGYTESLTNLSYEGQTLALTHPLIGDYGPANPLDDLPLEHSLAKSSLAAWLKENGVPAIYGVGTRVLTKKIRKKGSTLGQIAGKKSRSSCRLETSYQSAAPSRALSPNSRSSWREDYLDIPFSDPIELILLLLLPSLSRVSTKRLVHLCFIPPDVLVLDVGMKYNQIRCFTNRGVELKDSTLEIRFLSDSEPYDGIFVSNGPEDPTTVKETIARISRATERADRPIFGICLSHQLMAFAAGATTSKMKYENRGHNIPCTDALSGRCYITRQNHGFQVDADTFPSGWKELFGNANNSSNEGIHCVDKPFFSVQFHPESTPGPRDTEFLFDVFIKNIVDHATTTTNSLISISMPGGKKRRKRQAHSESHSQ
ncbi:class I glutamine amidotransferase-like protein [Lentinula edodes]|uniref:carbamoyl-phosphate synthase (glutamine-hydrolyzing) n=1 Tax=Lentinula lateritia TaxID=40482 RepID=A0A9W9DZT9_9AGAR|nr:class I glutamine amidotransferase-like protein [Lentinula edodes]